ncbi:MAG: hypothetical protein K8I29_07140 [Alphaproteobacteria bacterium]|uniref:EF-hand domain-containing protein n=1 Tax=Candidatus Nitrobium versatile TaxID=2884831 RepID=A0A953JDZ2_9BACT|nr:hypothetical protein [Candidatus Nitrobium versatile]
MYSVSGMNTIFSGVSQLSSMTDKILQKKDANADSVMDSGEATGIFKDLFSKIDTNGDSELDSSELNSGFIARKIDALSSHLISVKDADGDGLLTASELGFTNDDFSKIDTNGDGKADKSELNTASPLMMELNKTLNMLKQVSSAVSGTGISIAA